MNKRWIALAAIAGLSACGGGGGGGSTPFVPTPSPSSSATSGGNSVTFSIVIPAASSTSARTRPAFVSPNTGSIAFTLVSVNGLAQSSQSPTVAALGRNASGCTGTSSGTTCKITVKAPAGNDLFSIATYQSSNGTGAVLASTSIAAPAGSSGAAVALDLGGIPTAVRFSPARLPLVDDGTVQKVSVVVNAVDASGATIVGSAAYQSPVDLQIQDDPAGALALSTSSVQTPGTVVTVTYDSMKTLADGSIVARDNGMQPATLVAAPLVVNPLPVTILDDASSQAVSLTEAGFSGTFAGSLANAADGTLSLSAGTLGSGSAVVTIVPKVSFDVTTLNVSDGSTTFGVPVQIVPDHGSYAAIGPEHTLQNPTNIVQASNGTIWTGDSGTGNLVAFNTSTGAYSTFNVDPSDQGPNGIALDANGNIWYADGPQIGEFNTSTNAVTATYSTGLQANAWITDIIAGPGGTMWFYDQGNPSSDLNASVTAFGSIATASGAIVEYPTSNLVGPVSPSLGSTRATGLSMALASDGSIWFADTSNDAIGHLSTSSGAVTETKLGAPAYPQQSPQEVTIASSGKVWFSSYGPTSGTGTIGYVDPSSGNVTYYPLSADQGQATSMFAGSDGNLWFALTPMSGTFYSSQQDIGVVNPATGAVYVYPTAILPQFANAASIVDASGTFWVLDNGFGQIGKVSFK